MKSNSQFVLLPVLLTAACASDSIHAEQQPLVVFILAGQSNMQGQGVVEMNHPDHYNGGKGNLVWSMLHSDSKERMQHLRNPNGSWVVRDDLRISFKVNGKVCEGDLAIGYTGYGRIPHIGPELQFGHVGGDHFEQPGPSRQNTTAICICVVGMNGRQSPTTTVR